jgi:hypothetical protein
MTINECGTVRLGYCSIKKPKIDVQCHDLKKDTGDKILFEVDDVTCFCICSCLGKGTEVTLDAQGKTLKVENIVEKETTVLAAGRDLKFRERPVLVVSHSAPGRVDHAVYLRYTAAGKQYESCVTMSHPFMLKDGKLVGAEVLTPASQLVDRHGNAVTIDELKWGTYEGEFWEFSTRDDVPDKHLTDHLVVTNGVVTGDFAVEQWVHYRRTEDGRAPEPMPPIIGSKEWIRAHGAAVGAASQDPVRRVGNGYFTPASHQRVVVPPHASSFLPPDEAAFLEEYAPRRAYNDPMAHEMCKYLLDILFRPRFKDITFHFDWFSHSANTYSWVDDDHSKHVLLSGGIARIEGFDLEGVALALAHEVGHLLGKPDIGNSGVTCEGEADWWAGYSVLRQLWFGEEFFTKMKRAIAQVEVLYGYLLNPPEGAPAFNVTPQLDSRGRKYPSHECRLKTFRASMQGVDQPECSRCTRP